jgi:hypothetical protein
MGATFEGGQGPEGAVVPWMVGNPSTELNLWCVLKLHVSTHVEHLQVTTLY